MNVIVIGKPRVDTVLNLEDGIKENKIVNTNEKIEMIGGSSIYLAYFLKKWGVDVYFHGLVGGDELGNKIKTFLENNNIDTKYLEFNYECKTDQRTIMINKKTGKSTSVTYQSGHYVNKYRYDITPDYIIIDGTDMMGANAAINNYPTSKIIFLANNVSDEYYNLSKKATYVCASESFAEALTKMKIDYEKSNTIVDMIQKVRDLNKAEYIFNLINHGCVYVKDLQVKYLPKQNYPLVNDTMMEYAFFAAYSYGIINNLSLDVTAKMANLVCYLTGSSQNFYESIPSLEEVYKTLGINNLNINQSDNSGENGNPNNQNINNVNQNTNSNQNNINMPNNQNNPPAGING